MRLRKTKSAFAIGLLAAACEAEPSSPPADPEAAQQALHLGDQLGPQFNKDGWARSKTTSGALDPSNPFFQSLGTNGRSCNSCHQAGEGWTITPAGVQWRFYTTKGQDPLFLPHDAANAPALDVSTFEKKKKAYSLMLERAVVRVGLPVKATSEFELVAADDPYGHASAAQLSLFRRPLSIANLRFATSINWDGRNVVAADPTNIRQALKNQSNGATVNHAQASGPLADDVRGAIADFQLGLFTAQEVRWESGLLNARGAQGGPAALMAQPFSFGMNLPGPGFDRNAFTLFSAWNDERSQGRRDVAAGQTIFNTRAFAVATPGGSFQATCSGCHHQPNLGGSSTFQVFDVGVSSPARRAANVPLYTLRNKATGEEVKTTDPGRALITGLWSDMNKFKVPVLRALAARPPYFHDGSAATIDAVVDHYDRQFGIGFSRAERRQLIAFLESL